MYYNYYPLLDDNICSSIIKDAEYSGFSSSPIRAGGAEIMRKDVRNNERTLYYPNSSFLSSIEKDLLESETIPKEYKGMKFSRLNDVFRIYKYTDGQYFRPHKDGCISLGNEETQLTVLVYLNSCETGATLAYPYGISQAWKVNRMKCVTGMALVFDHDMWHEGEEVLNETKYVLRTDAFYFKE